MGWGRPVALGQLHDPRGEPSWLLLEGALLLGVSALLLGVGALLLGAALLRKPWVWPRAENCLAFESLGGPGDGQFLLCSCGPSS